MRVKVKYCGGCNPRYDRAGLVRKVVEDFPAVDVRYGATPEISDFVLVVCGCSVRCASHEELRGVFGKWIISSLEEYPLLYQELCKWGIPARGMNHGK